VADIALETKTTTIDDLKAAAMGNANVGEKLMEMVAKIGEKIEISRFEQVSGTVVVPYIHQGYRIGVLVGMNQAANEGIITAGRDVAMQIAAMKPLAVDAESVPEEMIAREKAIAIEQIVAEGKAADMAEKIAVGKLTNSLKTILYCPSLL